MSTKQKILHAIARSDSARNAYGALKKIPLAGPGIEKVVHTFMPPGSRIWVQIPAGLGKGLWMYADPRFDLSYFNGDHEPWIQELLKSQLRAGDRYYDVGAHAGFFALIASRFVGPSGKIVAFEPDPGNAATFKANMAKNRIHAVALVEAGVWSSKNHVIFQRALGASNRSQGKIANGSDVRLERISIPTICLDDFVFSEGNPVPQLIKMDIEGAELEALQGSRKLLEKARPKILCEVHDPAQMGPMQEYLRQFGYAAEEWAPVHEHYTDYRQLYLWAEPS